MGVTRGDTWVTRMHTTRHPTFPAIHAAFRRWVTRVTRFSYSVIKIVERKLSCGFSAHTPKDRYNNPSLVSPCHPREVAL